MALPIKELARRAKAPDAGKRASALSLARSHLPGILLACLVGGLVAGFFLNLYRAQSHHLPLGYDTARYLGQTALVAERGLVGASDVVLPPPSVMVGSQVGFSVLVLSLSRLFGVSAFKFAAVVPVAALAAMALAAGSLVSFSLRRSAAGLAVVALIVGTSTAFVRLFLPEAYIDNILAGAMFVAALVPLLSWVRGGRGLLASTLLLAGSGLAHPSFFSVDLGILGLTGLFLLPESWRAWRTRRTPLARLPVVRLVEAVAAASGVLVGFVYGFLGTAPRVPGLGRDVFLAKLRDDLTLYWFPVTVPLAAAGLVALAIGIRRGRGSPGAFVLDGEPARDGGIGIRFLLAIMVGWSVLTALGLAVFGLGKPLPAHRLLAFWLPLPLLGAVAVLAAAHAARSRAGAAAGIAVSLVGVIGLGWIGYHNLYSVIPRTRGAQPITERRVKSAGAAEAYLDAAGVPASKPVVFVVTDRGRDPLSGVQLQAFILRMMLSPDRVERAYVYVGEPEDFLAARPTLEPNDTRRFNQASKQYWPAVRDVLPRHPVALVLAPYNPAFKRLAAEHPDWVAAPGVAVLQGPRPKTPIAAPPIPSAPLGAWQLFAFGVAALVVFGLVGLGWASALLLGPRPFEVVALSVAFGLGLLVVGGTVLDAVGLPLGGAGGPASAPLIAGIGWLAAAWARRRRGRMLAEGGGTIHSDAPADRGA